MQNCSFPPAVTVRRLLSAKFNRRFDHLVKTSENASGSARIVSYKAESIALCTASILVCLYCRWKHFHHNFDCSKHYTPQENNVCGHQYGVCWPDVRNYVCANWILSVYSSDLAGYAYWSDFNETWPEVSPDISPPKYEVCYSSQRVKTIK